MAKRRLRDRVLAGVGQGLQDTSGLLMRTLLQDRQQKRIDDRALAGQEAILTRQQGMKNQDATIELLKAVAGGDRDPAQAASMIAAITGHPLDPAMLEDVRPSPRRRIEKAIGGAIDKAEKPQNVPDEAAILGAAKTENMQIPGVIDEPMSGDPFGNFRPEVREMSDRAGARRRTLEAVPDVTTHVVNADGSEQDVYGNRYSGPVQTKPNSTAQGVIAGNIDAAKELTVLGNDKLTDAKGRTQARIANLVEGLTRQAKVTTASAMAHAEKMAGLTPDVVDAEVAKAQRLAAGKENSTEGERRAATNWAPLVKAHATALELENDGARVGAGDRMFTDWPILNWAVDDQSKQYMQAAKDFISTLGLIRSGVTVRPDEADTLFSTMFGTEGDDAKSLKNKQQSREVFLSAMQAMVGRSGDEGGRILAAAINNKQIPATVLSSLTFDNKKLKDALLANLKGVPKFDLQGNPIGVQQ